MESRLKKSIVIILSFLLWFSNTSQASHGEKRSEYVVTKPVVNMYRLPSHDSDVVSQAIYGSEVTLLESHRGWERVRTSDQYTGWVRKDGLKRLEEYGKSGSVVRVSQLSANIYQDRNITKHEPIITIPWESRLEVIENDASDRRSLQVRLPDGRYGYVQRGDVSASFETVDIATSIAIAKRFLGVTYTWGGTSAFGFDCSGFVQMIMRQRGILMPRDADQQAAWTGVQSVERKDLQPGDLLYFGSSINDITHTGMYIGDHQFIHDTTHEHPMVQISNLDDAPWTTLLVAARRAKQ
jgi:cell wall-associated NlpC family hydrolase